MQIRARLNSRSHEWERDKGGRWGWGEGERGAGGIRGGKRRDKRRTGGETATGEADDEKGWKTRMDEGGGSGRWNGQIEVWVPRANRGGQVFSSQLWPRSATFHQPQNELGYRPKNVQRRWPFFFRQSDSRIFWIAIRRSASIIIILPVVGVHWTQRSFVRSRWQIATYTSVIVDSTMRRNCE